MKKKWLFLGSLSVLLLTSCGESSNANAPEGYTQVSETKIPGSGYIREYKHIKTGCHFSIVTGDGKAIVQMRDSHDIPYCD